MFHGECPVCHHHSLVAAYPQPPDHFTDEEYDAWMEDHADDGPVGVRCDNCFYEAE